MKYPHIIIIGVLLLSLTACEQHRLDDVRLQHLDSLADVDPARADTLLNTLLPTMENHTTPLHTGRGWGEGLLLLRIKVDDKLYRPITQYRDTILHLVNYFEKETHSLLLFNVSTFQRLNLSSAYLYAGRVFADLGDAPQALDYYQRALDVLPQTLSTDSGYSARRLYKQRGLLHSLIAEQFFYQGLHQEAIVSLQEANHWAKLADDTLDMIFNNRDIAMQYKFIEIMDSSLIYYQRSLLLSKETHDMSMYNELLVQLADLYDIQNNEKLAKQHIQPALQYVDSADMSSTYNIAAQIYQHDNNNDSAYYYYTKLLEIGNSYGKINAYRELSNFALQRNDIHTATEYFKQYKTLDDSIRSLDNAKTIARMHAAYNYSIREKEAQKYKEANLKKRNIIIAVTLFAAMLMFMTFWLLSLYRERKRQVAALNQKRKELEQKNTRFIENVDKELSTVKLSIAEVGKKSEDVLHALFREKRRLEYTSHIANIENHDVDDAFTRMKSTPIWHIIQQKIKTSTCKLSEEEWEELEDTINEIYNQFTSRLLSFNTLSPDELHTSLLLKIKIPHKHIAAFIYKTPQGETNMRKRLYDRFFHVSNGTAAEWDAFIEDL